MKANPGGQIDSSEVIGRDVIIEQIWDTLDQQSIRMNAERRIGKTTIIKKLSVEPRKGWVAIFQDLEQYHTALEFALGVYREVEGFLSVRKLTARRTKEFLNAIGGTEIKGILKLPNFDKQRTWKEILTKSLEDLLDVREKRGEKVVLLWDEVPLMIDNIGKREGQSVAMELLDTLRALRQELNGLRMILTGSIGFHHVIHHLKDYTNSPLNDAPALEILPLDSHWANQLAIQLLEGEEIEAKDLGGSAAAIAHLADGFPFYIHHIVKALKAENRAVTPELVAAVVIRQLVAPSDPWELQHYRERISNYYQQDNEPAVLGILDGVAVRREPASINVILAELKSSGVFIDREKLISLLRLVEQDHYLARNELGHYQFRFPLLKRWWLLSRGLESNE